MSMKKTGFLFAIVAVMLIAACSHKTQITFVNEPTHADWELRAAIRSFTNYQVQVEEITDNVNWKLSKAAIISVNERNLSDDCYTHWQFEVNYGTEHLCYTFIYNTHLNPWREFSDGRGGTRKEMIEEVAKPFAKALVKHMEKNS